MPLDGRIYDGFTTLLGMDGLTDPSYVPESLVAKSVNRTFRGGINDTRPPFQDVLIEFEDDELKELFETGNFQGAVEYKKTTPKNLAGIVVAIAGVIMFGRVTATKIRFERLIDGNDPFLMHTWFCQAEDQLYIQNGKEDPIRWDGINPAVRLTGADEMPIGTLMAYSHGRVFVSTADNIIVAGDIIYGGGFTDTLNTKNFTENTYFQGGGNFAPPAMLGQITGMAPMPSANNRDGQGELVVACESGFFTIDSSLPRTQWADIDITRIVINGAGCVSPWSLIPVNNDLWYKRQDGIGSYRQSRTDELREWSDTPLSREVDNWLTFETPWLKQFCSQTYFDNRILSTALPKREQNDFGFGDHRYFSGILALDLDKGSTVSRQDPFRWDGMWTGPRPTQLLTVNIENVQRCFVFSYGEDKRNHIYELATVGQDDLNKKKIEGFFVTRNFFTGTNQTNLFAPKQLIGGGRIRLVNSGETKISGEYRSDDYPCWSEYLPELTISCDNCGRLNEEGCLDSIARDTYVTIKAPTPEDECQLGSRRFANFGTEFQFKFNVTGKIKIPWAQWAAIPKPDDEIATCADGLDLDSCPFIDCCPEEDFTYSLVDVEEV